MSILEVMMTVGEKILKELETLCKDSVLDATELSQELSEFIGNDEVLGYHVFIGPFPAFPGTTFEIVMLSKKCLYDFEMKQQGALHHVVPLSQIIQISEDFEVKGTQKWLNVHFKASALGTGLIFQCRLKDIANIRKLSNAVIQSIAESA